MRKTANYLRKEANNYILKNYEKRAFERWSITRWAFMKIIDVIEKAEAGAEVYTAERFAKRMDDYSCSKMASSWKFSVAHDAANLIIDILVSYLDKKALSEDELYLLVKSKERVQ